MPIALQTQPVTASAALVASDVTAILAALAPVVTLPVGKVAEDVLALNLIVQPTGAGVLNIRFSK